MQTGPARAQALRRPSDSRRAIAAVDDSSRLSLSSASASWPAVMRMAMVAAPLAVLASTWTVAAQAEALPATPSETQAFTFKRIGAPVRGSTAPRITIHIDPATAWPPPAPPKAEPDVAATPVDADQDGAGPYAAFWNAVSDRLDDAGPGRLEAIVTAAGSEPTGLRLDDIRRIADLYGRDILRLTVGTNVSPALVAAVVAVESSGRPGAVSPAGAAGLMQLMPDTAARFGVADSAQPSENLRGGIEYLDWLLDEFGLDPVLALAGYNAGEGAVRRHGGVPPFAETRAYVPRVMAAYRLASALCLTPPQLISDGCVFMAPGT